MADIKIYNNTSNKTLVPGQLSTQPFDARSLPLSCPDTVALILYFLQTPVGFNPQDQQNSILQTVPTTGLLPFFTLTDGLLGGTTYAAGAGWAADASLEFFRGTISLDTATMRALLAGLHSAPAYLNIGYIQNGVATNTFTQLINVTVSGISIGAPVPVPNLTALSVEAALQMFYPIAGKAGLALRLISQLGKEIDLAAVDNGDGTARVEGENL